MVMLLTTNAFAQECFNSKGSLIVPGMYATYVSSTYEAASHIFLSNVTGSSVDVKVTVYDQDGNDITTGHSMIIAGAAPTLGGTFTLPAYSTRLFKFYNSIANQHIYGHAVVEWTSADSRVRKALIGTMYRQQKIGSSYTNTDYVLNGGQPF